MTDIVERLNSSSNTTAAFTRAGAQPAQSREDEAVRKAWARLCNTLHSSPDAPYPGMSEAFEQHFSQSFTDREWRAESATWAAAWKAAKRHEAQEQPAPDLLEALQNIAEYWNQDQNEAAMADACWHAIHTARAAIAKATGEQP